MDEQARMLHNCAIDAPIANFLEVGTFVGRSASVIGQVAKLRNGFLICVDWFAKGQSYWNDRSVVYKDTLISFRENMEKLGLNDRIITLRGRSENVLPLVQGSFGMVYIDGGHFEKPLTGDLNWAWEHTVKNGFICLHDYGNKEYPDVKTVIDKFISEKGITIYLQSGSLVVLRK